MTEKDIYKRYIDECIKYGAGIESGNYKKANKATDKIIELVTELNKNQQLEYLFNLLDHENDAVRLISSSYLLEIDKESRAYIALANLIGKPKSLVSFTAKVTLDEWNKGTLRRQFKE